MMPQTDTLQFRLSQFEGPLDLLLHLIHKAKIDLQDIFVSEITEQYLRYMEEIQQLDMDRASDFLNMAATLLYIKSRSLLPARREEEADEGFVDPETELINRLRAYQLYKVAGAQLAQMEESASQVFYKLPDELFEGDQELILVDASADALYEAFLSILQKHKEQEKREDTKVEISHDSFSIRKQKSKIMNLLKKSKAISFFTLFEERAGSMEVAVTFVALLELWHAGKVTVKQRSHCKDISISAVEE